MMTYTRARDRLGEDVVTLTLSADEYDWLLTILGFAVGAASTQDRALAREILRFVNELNRSNPDFTPYEILDSPAGPVP